MISQRVRTLMCALFALFLFVYIYCFQSPLLALVQHQLAEGQTVYMPLVSAIVLTAVLMIVQRLVVKWVDFPDELYAVSFIPPAVLTVLLTAFTPEPSVSILVMSAIFSAFFVVGVVLSVSFHGRSGAVRRSFAHHLLLQLVNILPIGIYMGASSHSDDVLVYELSAARAAANQNYEEALEVGQRSLAVSDRLTALRAYALARTERGLGDRLFTYPLASTGARQLIFHPSDTLNQLLHPDSLFADFMVWPSDHETALAYFRRVKAHSVSEHVRDYWLTALLLEKHIDEFCKELPHFYEISDSTVLPRHYKEALTMEVAGRRLPLSYEGDSLSIAAYNTFMREREQYTDTLVASNKLRRKYGDTYWWYYYYQKN